MSFATLNYLFFLIVVFLLYWSIPANKRDYRNLVLLVSSYFFYGLWDWRFLFLLAISTIINFGIGTQLVNVNNQLHRRRWLTAGVLLNISLLFLFKYFNFFSSSFVDFACFFGINASPVLINIILPVGISFYTFHGLSYLFDIYQSKIKPEPNWIDFSLFVSFFPLLVAGPIERASHLLPQLKVAHEFDYLKAVDGIKQIVWGLFKKVVIADNCSQVADQVFNNFQNENGASLLIGGVFFSIQIYADFSGYSDIAIGTARLLGIELLRNFSNPYFSRDIAEFWRRWHISLSSWFKDYVYIPLGGSKMGVLKTTLNIFIIFLLSGFWHGANYTFLVWGFLNACYILPSVWLKSNRDHLDIIGSSNIVQTFKELGQMVVTFFLATLAWIFFRSETLTQALTILHSIFSDQILESPEINRFSNFEILCFIIVITFIMEWIGRYDNYSIKSFFNGNRFLRFSFYYALIVLIFVMAGSNKQFIYFQF